MRAQSEEEALAGANVMSAGANAATDAYATEPFVCEFEPSFACGGGPGFNARHPDDAFSRCYYDPQSGCWDKDGLDPVEAARNADRCGTDECAAAWDTPVEPWDHGGSAPKLERMKDEKPLLQILAAASEKRRHARAGAPRSRRRSRAASAPSRSRSAAWAAASLRRRRSGAATSARGCSASARSPRSAPAAGYNAGFETATTCGKLIGDVQERALAADGSHENACFIVSMAEEVPECRACEPQMCKPPPDCGAGGLDVPPLRRRRGAGRGDRRRALRGRGEGRRADSMGKLIRSIISHVIVHRLGRALLGA